MDDMQLPQFPFVSRKMLSYEQGTPLALRLTVHSNSTSVVKIQGFTKEAVFSFEMAPVGDLTQETEDFRLTDFPIWLSIVTDDDTIVRGDVYAKVEVLIRGTPYGVLAQGYVASLNSPSWPNGANEDSFSGRGKIRLVTGSNPAAGAEISETVPANLIWEIKTVRFTLVTDVTVTSRKPHLVLTDGATPFFDAVPINPQTASQTFQYTYAHYGGPIDNIDNDDMNTGLAGNIILPAGFQITTDTVNLQAGDDFTAPLILVEQWILPS